MPTLSFPTWRDVPEKAWRWPSFSPAEIACRGTGAIKINTEAMDKLQALRDRLGKPLIVRSAYRSPEHNRAVGGAPASKHMQGLQFVHGFRVDLDRAGAAAGDLGGREVRPAPGSRGDIAPVGVGQGGHGGSSR